MTPKLIVVAFYMVETWANKFMPPAATDVAEGVDALYGFLLAASLVSLVILIGGTILFAMRYRRRSDQDRTPRVTHNLYLELAWSGLPLVVFLLVFAWGWWLFVQLRAAPEEAFEVYVHGKKWAWDFRYKSGKTSPDLVVPVNTPIKLIMSSEDVIHSFFVPSFRIKQDVVPGRYTSIWFEANKLGEFQVFCAEYCGTLHSKMLAKVLVKTSDDFDQWLGDRSFLELEGLPPLEVGRRVYQGNQCIACHSLDGSVVVGPTFLGLYRSMRDLADGSEVKADENYLRSSILAPNSQIVKGYPVGVMPSYQGQLSEIQLAGIIEFIKSLEKPVGEEQ